MRYTVINVNEAHYRYMRLDRLNNVVWVAELSAATELTKSDAIRYARKHNAQVLTYDSNYNEVQITRY